MSFAKRVFELQQVEHSIQTLSKQVEEVEHNLNHNEEYELAKNNLTSVQTSQKEREKQYKELDAEAEELRNNLSNINDKLYGGKIKNPKELVGFEQEAAMLKAKLAKKDDVLLELMEKTEAAKIEIGKLQEIFHAADEKWKLQKVDLETQAANLKSDLSELQQKRTDIQASIDKATLSVYESIRGRKGTAVVKVEQGRCLGCRVSLSINELQKAKSMAIVTCSNCGRILYLS
jgi:uncharacterized protein